MSLLETQNFLARIYTDARLRREFLSQPERVGRENNLTERETAELAEIFPEELNAFAESLFWKRLREVEKILPLTRRHSGADFEKLFREFSQTFNPQSSKKHLEDALKFADYLQTVGGISKLVRNTAESERSKFEFRITDKLSTAFTSRFDFVSKAFKFLLSK